MTTHALDTTQAQTETGIGLSILRYLDLAVLVLALPVFLLAALPMLGYATVAVAWLLQRAIQGFARRQAAASGDRRAAVGVLAGSMIGRLGLLVLAVLCAGLVRRDAGLAAGVFAAVLFTVSFTTLLIVTPIEQARR